MSSNPEWVMEQEPILRNQPQNKIKHKIENEVSVRVSRVLDSFQNIFNRSHTKNILFY